MDYFPPENFRNVVMVAFHSSTNGVFSMSYCKKFRALLVSILRDLYRVTYPINLVLITLATSFKICYVQNLGYENHLVTRLARRCWFESNGHRNRAFERRCIWDWAWYPQTHRVTISATPLLVPMTCSIQYMKADKYNRQRRILNAVWWPREKFLIVVVPKAKTGLW